jgi:signal transduction histidine kinase
LSAGVAHEIRNPLTGIATSAEILAGRLGQDDQKSKYVRAILDETSRLDEIIRNLLNFAKPAKPRMGPCAPGDISRRVVGFLSDQAEKKGIVIEVRDELGDDVCHADSNQLTQVLLNVVLNAIDACDRGNTVEVIIRKDAPTDEMRDGTACITITDDGPGVPEEVRTNLFDPFVTTKTHGTGLGLAICQQIIEEHEGVIGCEFLEKGTRFTVRLPLKDRETARASRANRSKGE